MGQVESQAAAYDRGREPPTPSSSVPDTSQHETMESLISEAMAYNSDENESFDARVEKALECPCVAELRSGSCGAPFTEAFICFLKSTAEEKGSDCITPFIQLQKCIEANPNAFSKDALGENEDTRETNGDQEYKIIPPLWSVDRPPSPRSKI
uniref:Mitochondrial intermembrane space import and assembly protein 40 homolog n=1 Tax=Kalanchoe fedtschenkoi TaxID=63787 RepID=A0A7N0T436_KALFE